MDRWAGWLVSWSDGWLVIRKVLVHFNLAARYRKTRVISEFANASILVSKLGGG